LRIDLDIYLYYILFPFKDGKRTRSGDLFSSVVKVANSIQKVVAVGVNCTAPENITELLEEANKTGNRKALVCFFKMCDFIYLNKGCLSK